MKRAALVAILLAACGSPVAIVHPSPSTTASPAVAAAASASQSAPPAPVQVLSIVDTQRPATTVVHLITITGQSATSRLLLNQPTSVLDARNGIALITTSNYTQLAALDLTTGAVKAVGSRLAGELESAALSPDATQAAVLIRHADLATYEIDIMDLASGATRTLLQIGSAAYKRAGLDPVRWLYGGILVTPGVWDCSRSQLMNLDPQTGTLTPITQMQLDALSPHANFMAAADYLNLGDAPYDGQCGWHNRLSVARLGGAPTVIALQKNRDLYPLYVGDDGTVLYRADGAPQSTPTPNMGLYLAQNGRPTQLLLEATTYQWMSATMVGPDTALATKQVAGGVNGKVEIDILDLRCTFDSCATSARPVETDTGQFIGASLRLVG